MQFTIVSGAAVLLALAPTALSAGTAHVVNNCGFDVWYAYTPPGIFNPMVKLPANGISEPYDLPGQGISIKMAPTSNMGAVTQFEYTWANGDISYDISHINGNPFMAHGTRITPSTPSSAAHPTCITLDCPAGEATCSMAYNQPNDVMTHVCGQDADLVFELCTAGGSNSQTRSVDTTTQTTVETDAQTTSSQPTTPSTAPSEVPSWPGSGHWHGRQHARHLPKK